MLGFVKPVSSGGARPSFVLPLTDAPSRWVFSGVSAGPLRVTIFLEGKVRAQGGNHMPRELERHLVVEVIPAEMLASVISGEEPGRFPLDQGVIAEYGDWELVSHTFDVRNDGAAILAVIFETKARRAR